MNVSGYYQSNKLAFGAVHHMTWIPPENNIITAEQKLTKVAKSLFPNAKTVTLKDQASADAG